MAVAGATCQTATGIDRTHCEVPSSRDAKNPFALFDLVQEDFHSIRAVWRRRLRLLFLLLRELVRPALSYDRSRPRNSERDGCEKVCRSVQVLHPRHKGGV